MNTSFRLFIVIVCMVSFRVFGVAERISDLSASSIRNQGATLSWTVPDSSAPIIQYDIRMSTNPITSLNWDEASIVTQSEWLSEDVQYQAYLVTNGKTNVTDIVPVPGSTLESRTAFSWSPVQGATNYVVEVTGGNSKKVTYDVGSDTAASLPIPTGGSFVYIRIWYKVSDVWGFTDFQYVAPSSEPTFSAVFAVEPASGEEIGSPVKISWNLVKNAAEYWVSLGSSVSGTDIYNKSNKKETFVFIGNIPQDGRLLHLTVWWRIGRNWYFRSFDYQAKNVIAEFNELAYVSPTVGSALMSPSLISWSPIIDVDEYFVDVGSVLGGKDLASQSTGTDTSLIVRNIPQDGRNLFLRIWYRLTREFLGSAGSTEETPIYSLESGVRYYFAVKTLDRTGYWSPISNVLSFETSSSATSSVGLSWVPPSSPNIAGYKVYMGTQSGMFQEVKDVGLTTTVTWSGLEDGKTYYFVATTYDNVGLESKPSNQVEYTP